MNEEATNIVARHSRHRHLGGARMDDGEPICRASRPCRRSQAKWELVKSIPLTARCSEEHISVQSVYIGQVEWSVEVKTGRHRTFAVLLQDGVELRRWSERAIDQMNNGSGSAEPYSPPSMVVLFSGDHSLPRKGYSSSLRHDRPSCNVVCSTVQATE